MASGGASHDGWGRNAADTVGRADSSCCNGYVNQATCPGCTRRNPTVVTSSYGKAYMALAVLESAFLLVVAACVAGADQGADNAAAELYSGLAMFSTLFFLYISIDSIWTENKIQFALSVCVGALLTGTIMFKVTHNPQLLGSFWMSWRRAICGVKIGFQVVYVLLAYKVQDEFGYFSYKVASSDVVLQELYRNFRVYLTLLKVDLFCGCLLLLMGKFFLFKNNDPELALDTLALIATFLLALAGWLAAVLEHKGLAAIFLASAVVEPVYVGIKLYKLDVDPALMPKNVTYDQFAIIGTIAILVRVALLAYANIVRRGFGQELRERVFRRKASTGALLGAHN